MESTAGVYCILIILHARAPSHSHQCHQSSKHSPECAHCTLMCTLIWAGIWLGFACVRPSLVTHPDRTLLLVRVEKPRRHPRWALGAEVAAVQPSRLLLLSRIPEGSPRCPGDLRRPAPRGCSLDRLRAVAFQALCRQAGSVCRQPRLSGHAIQMQRVCLSEPVQLYGGRGVLETLTHPHPQSSLSDSQLQLLCVSYREGVSTYDNCIALVHQNT